MTRRRVFGLVVLAMAWVLCSSFQSMPSMLELSTRPYLYELSQKYSKSISKLSDIPEKEIAFYASMGMEYVWFMGVWELGAYGLARSSDISLQVGYGSVLPDWQYPDIIGSPYAVVEYTVNEQLGTMDDLDNLRALLKKHGMKLIVDFVPNHSAIDAPLVSSHPEYYIHAPKSVQPPYDANTYTPMGIAYGRDQYDGPWTDTAQYNHWNMDLRSYLINTLVGLSAHVDGFRCDMSMLPLNDIIAKTWTDNLNSWGYSRPSTEFWGDAISTVKAKYPDTIFLGEAYWNTQSTLQSLGFDFLYDKDPYDSIASNDIGKLNSWASSAQFDYLKKTAHFVENHDEKRAVAEFGGVDQARAAAAILFTLPGMKFHFQDQWNGAANRIDVHLRRSASESGSSSLFDWYTTKFLPVLMDPVFHEVNSTWTYRPFLSGASGSLIGWEWSNDGTKYLCVTNYGNEKAGGSVVLPDVSGSGTVQIKDLLSGQSWSRSADDMRNPSKGLTIVLDSYDSQIIAYP